MEVHPDNEGLNAFSSIDIVSQCLVDKERTEAFGKAIKNIVKDGDSVLDLGTGSSILSLFAAEAGAKQVTSVEYDPFIGKSAYRVVKANGFEDTIEIKITDARNCIFRKNTRFDVVIAELITTGFIDEHQVTAINNLYHRGVVDNHTKFIPQRQKTFITLGNFDFEAFRFSIPFVRHLWRFHREGFRKFEALTSKLLLNSFDFSGPVSEKFEWNKNIVVDNDGIINCAHLSSITELTRNISIHDTDAINGPVAVPLEPFKVSRGDAVRVTVNYLFGGGFENVKISLKN